MVEWKKLGEVANRNKGIPITAGQMSELATPYGNVRVFAAGQTIADIDEKDLPSNCAHREPSVIVKSRGYVDFEFYENPFTHKNEMWSYSFKDKQTGKYVYYYLTTKKEFFRKKAKANSVKLPQLCVADTDNYLIPIPLLSEQQRIVSILDTFTSSIANLKQQIEERRRQYEYERDRLLDLEGEEGVEMKKLGEVAELVRGKVISKDYIRDNEGEYPVYSSQTANDGVLGCVSSYMFDGDYLTWTTDGAYAGTIFRRSGKFNITNVCGLIDIKDERLDLCFLYYWLSLTAKSYVLEGMGNPKLMSNVASTIKIPILHISEQQRIVSILDRFDTLCNDITYGLPAEIEARKKQYEYYRDKLLAFKEAGK